MSVASPAKTPVAARSRLRATLRLVLFITVVAAGALLARRYGLLALLRDQDHLQQVVRGYGLWAPLAYGGLRMAASLLMLPLFALTLATGFLFSPLPALAINLVTTWLAAMIAFYVARGAGREAIQALLPPKLARFDAGLAADGFRMMVFLRINPAVPFNAISYWAGLTRLTTRDYSASTIVGMLPHVAVYTYLGAGLAELSPLKIGLAIAGLTVLSLLSLKLKRTNPATAAEPVGGEAPGMPGPLP